MTPAEIIKRLEADSMTKSDDVPLTNEQAYELAGKILSGEVTTANGLLFTIYSLRDRCDAFEAENERLRQALTTACNDLEDCARAEYPGDDPQSKRRLKRDLDHVAELRQALKGTDDDQK